MRNVLVSLALLAATGCSLMIDPDGVEPIKIVSSIAVTPATATVPQGATRQLAATATYADGSTGDVTAQAAWTSSAAGVATVSSAPGTKGLVTAAAASGSATITATFQGKTATSSVTAAAAELASVAVTAATGTVVRGTTLQLTATATYTDATTANVTATATWTTSDADVASVSTGGLVTGVAAGGPVTFTATFGTQSGSLAVTVTVPAVTSVVVTPSSPTVLMGSPQQLTAVAFDSGSQMTDVSSAATWSSSDPSKATVSASGLVTPVAAGQTTITATYATKSGTATVTVPSATVTLTSIAVTPSTPTVAKGATAQLTATATFSDSLTDDVTEQASWTSGTAAVATVSDYPGSKGSVAGVAASGTAIITATFGGQSGTATVTAAPAAVASIAVTPATATVAKGATQQLVATATYTDATTANVTASATWTTSAAGVASVSTAGLVTAAAASGSATISAALAGKTGSATVTAAPAVVASIAVTPPSATVANGATQQLVATATYTDATTSVVTSSATWTTSNPSVATVSSAGLVTGVAISGTTTITATLGSKSGTAVITAAAKSVASIEVTPVTNALSVGEVLNLVATAHYSDATTAIVTTDSTTSWQSSAPGVATVSNTGSSKGRVTALSESGTAVTITATFGGKSGTATVTVGAASVQSIAITPAAPETAVGGKVQLTATATYTDTTTQDVTNLATWSSGTASVAIVDDFAAKGLVTGVSGTATASISATFGGQVGIRLVTVKTVASIAVTGYTAPVPAGTTVQLTATATLTGGGTQDVTAWATWTSGAAGTATVSDAAATKGLVTAVAQSGSATISAALGGRTGSTSVTTALPLVASIAVTPSPVSLAKGTTQPLTATATYTDATTGNVTQTATWTTANAAVATVTTTGTRGVVTAVDTGGPVNVTASLGGQSGSTAVTVTGPVVTSVAVTPAPPATILDVAKGLALQLRAVATYSDATTANVTSAAAWSPTTGSAIATVSDAGTTKGLVSTLGVGAQAITATYSGVSGSATVNVGPATLASVAITPAPISIPKGGHRQLTVTGTYTDGSQVPHTADAAFSVAVISPPAISVGAGPADKGMLRALEVGSATVTASVTASGVTRTSPVVSVDVGPVAIVSIEIGLYKDQWSPYQSPSLPYSVNPVMGMATATWSDGRTTDVTSLASWRSSDPTVVSVATDAAARGQVSTEASTGGATLSAAYGGVTGTLAVTVHSPVVIWVVPFPSAMAMPTSSTFKVTAVGVFDDWSFQDVTEDVTWSSDAPAVAGVSNTAGSRGTVTSGTSVGPALITATHPAGSTSAAAVFVKDAASMGTPSFRIVPATPVVSIVRPTRLQAVMEYPDGSIYDVSDACEWSSSDTSVITVDWEGQALALKTQPLPPALPASVTAWYPPPPFTTHAATVTPTVGVGDAMVQFSGYPVLSIGQTLQLRAFATSYDDPLMVPVEVTNLLAWYVNYGPVSFDPAVPGKLTAGAFADTFEFYASDGNRTYWGNRGEVRSASIQSVQLDSPVIIPFGGTGRLVATATFTDSSTADVTDYVAWNTANPVVVAFVGGLPGTLRGASVGNTTITAFYPGIPAAAASVQVNGSGVTSIAVSPGVGVVGAGTEWSGPYVQFTAQATYGDSNVGDLTPFVHWSLTDPEVAYFLGYPSNAVRGLQIGSTTVVASYGQALGTATLDVGAREPDWLNLYGPWQLYPNVPDQLQVVGRYNDSPDSRIVTEEMEWTSSNPLAIAVSNAPGSRGRVTAFGTAGSATITGTFPSGTTVTQVISINGAYGALISLGSITPNSIDVKSGGRIPVGISGNFTGCASCGDLTDAVTWRWMDPFQPVATVGPGVDEYGNYGTYVTGRTVGINTLCAQYPGFADQCVPVNVTMPTSASLTIEYMDPNNSGDVPCKGWGSGLPGNFAVGAAFELRACLNADNGQKYDVTELVLWSTDAGAVASVSNVAGRRGQVMVGDAPGAIATITAWYGLAATFAINVSTSAALDFIGSDNNVALVRPGAASGGMGGTRIIARYTDGSSRPVTKFAQITLGDPTVATLGDFGEWGQLDIIGLMPEPTWMQASFGGLTLSQALMTDTRQYTALQVALDGPSRIPIGAPVQARVVAFDPIGMPWDLTEAGKWVAAPWHMSPAYVPTWSSSNPAAAAVSNDAEPRGVVTGLAPGFTDVGVTIDGLTDTVPVEVTDATLVSLGISEGFQAIPGGGVVLEPFTAIATYSDGTQLDVTKYASWDFDSRYVTPVTGKPGEFVSGNAGTGWVLVSYGMFFANATVLVF